MTHSSLFIINSPFQALCTAEAIKEYNISNYLIVLLRNRNDKRNDKTEKILEDFSLKYTHVFITSFYGLLKKGVLKKFDKSLYNCKYNNVFIGDYYSSSFRLFSLFFTNKNSKTILLDDGSATLLLYEYGLNHIKVKSSNVIIKNKFVNLLTYFRSRQTVSFFSIFKPNNSNLLFVQNSLSVLAVSKKTVNANNSYIIGTSMSEQGMLTEDAYFEHLYRIISKFPNETFYYCPHRVEGVEKLQKIQQQFNIEIFNTEYTIEYDFYKKDIMPHIIIGFGSTALYTLKTIYPNIEAYSILFDSNDEINSLYEVLNNSYKQKGILFIK